MKNKTGAIIRLVIWSVVLVLVTGILLGELAGAPFQFNPLNISITDQYLFNDGEYNRGGGKVDALVDSLEIEWISGEVTVTPYEGETILLEETSGLSLDEQLRWKAEGTTLKIFPRKPFRFMGVISLPEKDLNIYLPQGMVPKELEITSVSGEIDLKQFSCTEAALETVSGDINVLGCDSVSGNLSFNGNLQQLDWSGVSGDAELTIASMPREIGAECVSGDITIAMTDGPGFTVETDTTSGEFLCDFPLINSRRYGDGSAEYQFESVSGNVNLKIH